MGYYRGIGGRLVWQSAPVTGVRQPPPQLIAPTNTIECQWTPSLSVTIDDTWPPGAYLLKLVGSHRRAAVHPAVRPGRRLPCRRGHPAQRHHLAGLQPVGRLQPLLRERRRGPVLHPRPGRRHLRRPGPGGLLRPALRPRLGLGGGRLRGQRAPGDLSGRAARPGRDLLDRRRPPRATATARQPPGADQPGPRRVLVHSHARRGGPGPGRRGQLRLPRRQRLLPADPVRAVARRTEPAPGLLQVGGRGPDDRPRTPRWSPSTGRSPPCPDPRPS